MIQKDLPKEFCITLARSRVQIRLCAIVEPVVQIEADGRRWVYESYRNTLGLGGRA